VNWRAAVVCLLVATVVLTRLAHRDLIWIEEAYGMAAAAEILRGKTLYSEIWFDKPPLYAWFYAAFGAASGLALRLAGSGWVLFTCWLTYLLGRRLWSRDEGLLAAVFVAVGLTFWIPSAVMSVAPDLLMMAPHIGAVLLAVQGRSVAAGAVAGLAALCNSKGLLVLPVCALWAGAASGWLISGWLAVQVGATAVLPARDYGQQVWLWGWRYSADTFVANPVAEGLRRTANWAGFNLAAVVGMSAFLKRGPDWRLVAWLVISLVGVIGGLRFFPRYYFQLLPVTALMGARGVMLLGLPWRTVVLVLLLIPAVRFGGAYLRPESALRSDLALMQDSRRAGEWLRKHAPLESNVVVWGYRPDVYAFSGLAAGSRFLDSQPLTGVLADRHLVNSTPTMLDAAGFRAELARTTPEFLVDGLGPLNPALAITAFGDLREWLTAYEVVQRTPTTVIYRRRER
jgi:hypothetical protein